MPISPSSMPYPTRLTSEPTEEMTERIALHLKTTGEFMRLTAYIPGRMAELGWCERILELCREYLRHKSASGPGIKTGNPAGSSNLPEPSDIAVADIVDAVKDQAKILLPQQIYAELTERIVEFIGEHNLD